MADEVVEPGYSPPTVTGPNIPSKPFPAPPAGADTDGVDYESMTIPELKDLADQRGVALTSDMHKAEIVAALKG
jgi:hypothetical protein